jgi:hypothetical protein
MEQTWYADNAGTGGKLDAIKRHFEKLEEIGPHYGYFPEPSKSMLIVPQKNLSAALIAFEGHVFTITIAASLAKGKLRIFGSGEKSRIGRLLSRS